MRATRTGERYWYVLAGLLVGVLGAVLGAVLFAGHLLRGRSWRAAKLWWAGAAALALVLVLQPYLLANLSLLSGSIPAPTLPSPCVLPVLNFCNRGHWSMSTERVTGITGSACGRRSLVGR